MILQYAPHGNNGNGSRGRYVVLIGLAVFALCTLWIIERQFLPPVAVRPPPAFSLPISLLSLAAYERVEPHL
jgi:hypothetical protein